MIYDGDRSFESLKDFVMGLIKIHLDGAAKGVAEHKPDPPIEEMDSVPSEPVPIEAPDTTDDVSKMSCCFSTFYWHWKAVQI